MAIQNKIKMLYNLIIKTHYIYILLLSDKSVVHHYVFMESDCGLTVIWHTFYLDLV